MKKLILFILAVAASLAVVSAQTVTTGDISGTVADPTGAVIANARVILTNDATGEAKQATTNASGEYRFSLLRPGVYTVVVSSTGFEDSVLKASANLGQVATINVQLGIKKDVTTVNVTEQAPLVQADNANLATTYDTKQLENLPAPGNDMTAYAFTTPGVTVSTGGGYGNFSAFGLPGTSNLFTINGTDNMDPYLNLNNSGASNLTLGANEVQEAAVVLNGYTGQYGRQAGAQVNFITRSGANQFHGNAGWQWNGAALNANDWFNNANGTERPHAVSNEWTDSIGGPIKKNKAFFFFDNEGLRYVLPSGGPVYIPTTDFANAVLTHIQQTNPAAVPLYQNALNLFAGASGASRARPLTAADDSALGCGDFSLGAFGSTAPCARVFQNSVNNLNTEWLMAAKVDVNLSSNDRINFRYNRDRGVQATGTDPINPAFNANSIQPQDGGQFGYTRTLGSTMVNQLLLSATYYTAIFGPPDYAAAIKTFPTTFAFADSPFANVGGGDNVYPQGRKVRQWQLIDDFSKIWGAHTFKVGTNVRKNWVSTYATLPNQNGLVTFNSTTDFYNGMLTPAGGSTFSQAFPQVGAENVTLYSAGFYVQDEWKVRPNFTLTMALRFDRNSNITCAGDCFNEFGTPFSGVSHNVATPYNSTIHTGLSQAFPDLEPIVTEPRIGIAYGVTKSTVIRGGFGIFSDLYPAILADRFITNSPAVSTFTTSSGLVALNNPNSIFAATANSNTAFVNGFANGATLAQLQAAVPLGFAKPAINSIASTLRNPKYYEWNFEVQQSLGKNYMFSVNYVGNRGVDEFNQTLFGNAYAPNFAGLPTTAPDPRFAQIREFSNAGRSNYNGLVSSFRWRMGSDFSGSLSYTWSHALDTCSNACVEPFNALSAPSIRYQLSPAGLSYSNADYDTRHSFNGNYVYTVPTRYFTNSILKNTLGGWTAAGTIFLKSGYPFSIVDSGVRGSNKISNASGIATQPFLAYFLGSGYPSCTTPNVACYSASQFLSAAQQNNFGNVPRNSFRGPGYFNTDMNVTKTVSIHERYKVQFGAFFFNLFNHPNFDNPFNNLAVGGTAGQILGTVSAPTSAYGSFQGSAVSGRIIQTAIKFMF